MSDTRQEFRAMAALAGPVILAEMAWVLMGIVDTVMVGPLGPAAIGAVGTGSALFFAVMVLGMGTLFALDTFVAQAFGAGRLDDCHRWLVAGLQLAAVMSVVLVGVGLAGVSLLDRAGIHPEVLALLRPYLRALLWSVPPLMVFTVFRRYLQAMNVVRPVFAGVVVANLVNAGANWVLVYGHLGAPVFGVVGSAYATLSARVMLAVWLLGVIVRRERRWPSGLHAIPMAPDPVRVRALLRLGLPAAAQITLEVGVFAAISTLAARIAPMAVAANQIVLNIAGFVFMVPYGLSSAAAVRVGQAVGRGALRDARRAGWCALALGGVFALAASVTFAIVPTPFLRLFTADAGVLITGASLLRWCAVFQPFDASQTIATGALRGLGETRWPMVVNLLGHWGLGLPLAWTLCFAMGWSVEGLWAGLTAGIIAIGTILLAIWHRMSGGSQEAT
jgi:multidrug resistance protein, MATE family